MSDTPLKDTLGIEAVCPLSTRLYGGIPTGGGFQSFTEYEIGAQRIAEACHCILGSVGKLAVGYRDKAPWAEWRKLLAYEEDHIAEEIGLVTKFLTEYSRPTYDARVNTPRDGYLEWVDKTVHSMRTQGPKLASLARRRRQELSCCPGLPDEVRDVARAAYTVLVILGDTCHEVVAGWPGRPVENPYRDFVLGAAVWRLEKTVTALLPTT